MSEKGSTDARSVLPSTSLSQVLANGKQKKQVQVIGEPPPLPFGGRKAESRNQDSGGETEDDGPDEQESGSESEREEGRAEAEGAGEDIAEENPLANLTGDESVSATRINFTDATVVSDGVMPAFLPTKDHRLDASSTHHKVDAKASMVQIFKVSQAAHDAAK